MPRVVGSSAAAAVADTKPSACTGSGRPSKHYHQQPDDFEFFGQWDPPAHFRGNGAPTANLPHLDTLRMNGLQMMRAYTASAMCGTSRYSTITGRYPSRSATSRYLQDGAAISSVIIPTTKLEDVSGYGQDCSNENLAAVFKANGYRTGVMGKWHLHHFDDRYGYSYDAVTENIRQCGFDVAEAIYPENLNRPWAWTSGAVSHNMEHMTAEAIKFIDESVESDKEFFLYFNPTAPHSSGNVLEALTRFSCLDAPEGRLEVEPVIPGMTQNVGCKAYRRTVINRASDTSNSALGSVWVDDAVGALMLHLDSVGQLNNTFFLFQLDHGQEGKRTVFEPGVRLAQFIHYPNEIPAGQFEGLVSTIDIAPTVLDYAGISGSDSPALYSMDGISWKSAVAKQDIAWNDRCIITEHETDRAVICGCDKYISLDSENYSLTLREARRFGLVTSSSFLGLCSVNGQYVSSPATSLEGVAVSNSVVSEKLQQVLNCHLQMTRPSASQSYGDCDDEIEFLLRTLDPPTTTLPTASPVKSGPSTTASPGIATFVPTTSPVATVATPSQSNPTTAPTKAPNQLPLTEEPTTSPVETRITSPETKTTAFPTLIPTPQLETKSPSLALSSIPQEDTSSSGHTRCTAAIVWGLFVVSFILPTYNNLFASW
mmetsp:Transcript_9691/g.21739  ORF Transcript_9691/g.21739 Transcript_9691/m.21739 type:complete len:655 (-) Transcript_9691:177-2141(-)